jgi:hypothetical protein
MLLGADGDAPEDAGAAGFNKAAKSDGMEPASFFFTRVLHTSKNPG